MLGLAGLTGFCVLFVAIASRSWKMPDEGHGSLDKGVEPATEALQEQGSTEIAAAALTADGQRQPVEATSEKASEAAEREPERRLVIRDVDGRGLPDENGELVLESSEGAKTLVPFREGRFSLRKLSEGSVRIHGAKSISADGDRPIAFEEDWFDFRRDEPTLLAGHYLLDSTLRVVDARTGVPLDGVRVLPKPAGQGQSHPGPHFDASYVVRDETSPVCLPLERGIQPYWVSARGYGWKHILVDHEAGGERVVELEHAGRLLVEVHGDLDAYTNQSLQTDIRVYSHPTRSLVASSGLGSVQGFDGIVVGTYDVKVELGSADGSPIVLGETRVDVTANATCTAQIELTHDRVTPPRGRVRGEIVVPGEYRDLDLSLSLRIQPADGPALRYGDAIRIQSPHGRALRYRDVLDLERGAMEGRYDNEDGSEVFRWEAELSLGRYLFVVEPVQHGVLLDIPESPDAKIRILLPPLFPVTLRVIDARTHLPLDGAAIRWSRHFAEREADAWVEMDLEAGVKSATVFLARGEFTFAASAPNHGERFMDAYAGSGTDQFTLELSPIIPREITLVNGETVVPWEQGMTCSFRSLDTVDSFPCENLGDGKMRACFGQPGLHEILFGAFEGFQAVAPVVVDVREGDLSPVVVQLER